jgi:hypothetical protein
MLRHASGPRTLARPSVRAGFGLVSPLPGILPSLHLDTSATLPVGVEAYAAYALRAWLAREHSISGRTRRFAKWSAICSFALGMAGQVPYHLLAQAGAARAAWLVTTIVSCLPVLVLAMGTVLAHMLRDLVLAVDESLFPEIKGQAETEALFYLALTFGLADDPPDAVARAIGFVEACGRQRGITDPFQGMIATSDGESLWVFRYSSEGRSRSLFFSRDAGTVKRQYLERPALQQLSDDARFVISEPIGDLPGAWVELPEATYGVVGRGGDQLLPFTQTPAESSVTGI